MNIVFITGTYYPNFSANSKCVANIIEEIEGEHNVVVISYDSINEKTIEKYKKHTIIRVSTPRRLSRKIIETKICSSKRISSYFWRSCLVFHKALYIARILTSKHTIEKELVQAYTKALQTINHKLDVIIPVTNPIESTIAASNYKLTFDKETIVLPFLFDRFSTSKTAHWFKFNQRLKFTNHLELERKMIENSDKVLTYFSWATHIKEYFPDMLTKVRYIEHPLIKRIESKIGLIDEINMKTNMVYTGGLSKKIRSPIYTLELLKEVISANDSLIIDMYIKGDCNGIVNKFVIKHNINRILNNGTVSTDLADQAMKNGRFLLLIGNSDITQLQSKVYEYISCGRPIILIFKDEQDPVIEILDRYPYACKLKEDYQLLEENKDRLLAFIDDNLNSYIKFDDVEKLYFDSTPQYVANTIMGIVKEIYKGVC